MPTLIYGSSVRLAEPQLAEPQLAEPQLVEPQLVEPKRLRWQSFKRGLAGRCPACGEGRIFRAYLKVADRCTCCGEELHHHRADDAPPYFTTLIVGHVVGALLLIGEERWPGAPMWMPIVAGLALAVAMSLWLLPIVKGALIGWQWALRMHGFGGTPNPPKFADGT